MENTFTLHGEFSLPLSYFIRKEDYNNDYKIAQVIKALQEEAPPIMTFRASLLNYLRDCMHDMEGYELIPVLSFSHIKFQNIDSTSPWHSEVYFDFTVSGPKEYQAKTLEVFKDLLIKDQPLTNPQNMKAKNFELNVKEKEILFSSRIGTLNATYAQIVEIFGEPPVIGSPDGKVQVEWRIRFPGGAIVTIHDYKDYLPPQKITQWSIGGFKKEDAQLVHNLFKS